MVKEKWHTMPYIANKKIYSAVCFALKLKDNMSIGLAIYKAAKYYGVLQKEVAHYVGRTGARKRMKNNIYKSMEQGWKQENKDQ